MSETLFWIRAALNSVLYAEIEGDLKTRRRWMADAVWQVQQALDSLENHDSAQ